MVADHLHAFSTKKNVIASTSVAIPAQADLEVVLLQSSFSSKNC